MGLTGAVRRLAVVAPPSVLVVAGIDGHAPAQDLRLDPRIRLAAAPRQANVLLTVGRLTEPLLAAAIAAHDTMPAPRAAIEWRPGAEVAGTAPTIPGAEVTTGTDPVPQVVTASAALLRGERASSDPVRADADPAPWRGVGPYGQGGNGMTGGVPYGRPMAERDDDRDGLTLDALPVEVGPLFSGFPDGLTARVTFQGDLVHGFELRSNPFVGRQLSPADDPFLTALFEPVTVAELEVARARALLRWSAGALRLHGLHALSLRVLSLAVTAGPADVARVRRLSRWVTGAAVTGRQTQSVGVVPPERLAGLGVGPMARAAGLIEDVRTDERAYRELGFEPVTGQGSDARARWRQRLAEVEQSLELAGRAGARRVGGHGVVECPRGRLEAANSPTGRALDLVPDLVTGMEWGDAVATLTSLDLDLREAAAVRPNEARTVS